MLFKLLLLLAVGARTISSEGFGSIKEVFEAFQSRRSTHCDVSKHEAQTGYKPSCDTTPVNGLVPDGTVCVFWTGYFKWNSQVCEQGFWYQERSHPHHGQRVKRFFESFDELFDLFNSLSDNDVVKPEVDTSDEDPEEDTDAWIYCPSDPYEIIPAPGEITFLLEYDTPEYDTEGWVVSISEDSSVWMSSGGMVDILQVAGTTQSLSFVASNEASGRSKFCTIYFDFAAPQCDVTEIMYLDPNSCVDCDSDYTGINGEKCYMSCELGWKLSAANYATCEVQADGSTMWKWKGEEDDLEAAVPACIPSECTPDNSLETETAVLECYDPVTDNFAETSGPVMAGSFCERRCVDSGGLVCGDGTTETYETYNEYYCSYEETWDLLYEECGKGNIWQKCMEATVPQVVEHGELCCSHDTCNMYCYDGFDPSDDPELICKVDPADGSYKWFRHEYDMNDEEKLVVISEEEFPECQAQCGSLPTELLTNELKKDGPSDCSGMKVDEQCHLSCPEYYDLKGTDYVECIFNAATKSPEWHIPIVDGEELPWCEVRPCDDLQSPDHGTSVCEMDEDGVIKTCTVDCEEGFTHSLKYNTSFTCDPRRTGKWTDAKNIPLCYESEQPMIGLNLTVEVTATENQCYQLVDTLPLEDLKTAAFGFCPTGAICEAEQLFADYISENLCQLWLPVKFEFNLDGRFRDIVSQVASMVFLIVWQDGDISVTEPPSVTDFEDGLCPSGYSRHQVAEVDPVICVQCIKGYEYDQDVKDCVSCPSGNSFLGKCTDWEAEEPPQVFCNYDEIRQGLRFSNCSTEDMAAETVCKVHCESPDQEISVMGAVFAHCTEEGVFEYTPDEFTCEDVPCDPGYYSNTGMKPCRPCETGYYADTAAVGATMCSLCPDGTTTGYDAQMLADSCQPIDSVQCGIGDYYDDEAGKCVECPFGTYCPDGLTVENCPDFLFTRGNRSMSVADCVADPWTPPGDAIERHFTIRGLRGLADFESMNFYMRKPHRDVCVIFQVQPYELEICGDGQFWFRDSVSDPFEGRNLFSEKNMFGDKWVYISLTANEDGFILEYGRMWEWINSPADTRPTLEEGLQEMNIIVRPKEGDAVTLTPESVPYFDFMQLYSNSYSGSYPGFSGSYPGSYPFPGHSGSYPGHSGSYPSSYLGSYSGHFGSHPGSYPFPGHSGSYLGHSGTYPGSHSGSYPDSYSSHFSSHHGSYPFSGHSGSYPGHSGSYPGSHPGSYPFPGHSGSYPGHSGSYPGSYSGSFPGSSPGSYPGSYPFPGHSGSYPGHSGSYPGSYSGHFGSFSGFENLMRRKRGMPSGYSSSSFSNSGFPGSFYSGYSGSFPDSGPYPDHSGSYSGSYSGPYPGHSGSYPDSYSGSYSGAYPGHPGSGPYSGHSGSYSGPYPGHSGSYPSSYSGPYPGHSGSYPGSYPGPYPGHSGSYPGSYSGPYPGHSGSYAGPYPRHSGSYPGSYSGYSSFYPGSGYSGFYSGSGYGGSGDIPSHYGQHEKRDCFENLLNKNAAEDWPQTKPISCPPNKCPSGHWNPDSFTCEPCGFGEYYSADSKICESCPDKLVTRGLGKSNPTECVYDHWYVTAYDEGEEFSGPSAKIVGIQLPQFGALLFYLHRPDADVTVHIAFFQYELMINADGSFTMNLGDTNLIDGDMVDIFASASGTGWSECIIWMDEDEMELVFEYNAEQKRSPNLIEDLDLSEEDIGIPENEYIQFEIDIERNDPGITVEDSAVFIAYVQVFANYWEIEYCTSNLLFGQTFDYVESCKDCVSTNRPYSCSESAEFLSCGDPMEVFEDSRLTFDCTLGWGFFSTCDMGCETGYLHGDDSIFCFIRRWAFDWKKGIPSCKDDPPEPYTCPQLKLPDNMLKVDVDELTFTVDCDAGYELQMGFDAATQFVCDPSTHEWGSNPPDIDMPECYEPTEPKIGFPLKLQILNPLSMNCEQIGNRLSKITKSNAVEKNSPSGWGATYEIVDIHCGSDGAVRRKRASEDSTAQDEDERIQEIVHKECEHGEELECLENKWLQVKEYLEGEILHNSQEIQTLLQGLASTADPEQSFERMDVLIEKSFSLLHSEGLVFLFTWVIEEMDAYDENFEVQKGLGELYDEMEVAIFAFTEIVHNLAFSTEEQHSQFGLDGSSWLIDIDAIIMADVPPADKTLLREPVDMLGQFTSDLMSQGVAVIENYGITEVQCADGRDLAAKGLCEKKTCDEDDVLNEDNECERCPKWTSVINTEGKCVTCPENSRVKETKDGHKICAEQCPTGSFSADGFKNADTGNCTKCSPGEFQDRSGQQDCKPCTGLSATTKPGSTACTTDFDIELNNMDEEPIRVRNIFRTAIQEFSLAIMVRRRGPTLNIQIDIDEYRASIDDHSVTLGLKDDEDDDEPAVFEFDDDDVTFDEFTSILMTVGKGKRRVYIDGQLVDEIPYTGDFEIPQGSVLETSGNGDMTNDMSFISDRIETDPEMFLTRDNLPNSRNLFKQDDVEVDEIDDEFVKLKTTTFTGETINYCANSPCQNGGSCSRDMGTFKCACPDGYSGKKCEKQHEEKLSLWSNWHHGACSKTCGGGTQINTRRCSECSGEGCQGADTETVSCNTEPCKECQELIYSEEKVRATVIETPSKTTYTFSCPAGKVFAKQENELPATELHCGAETTYTWSPSAIPPECTGGSRPPKELKKRIGVNFSPGEVDSIDCTEPALSTFKSEFVLNVHTDFSCLGSGTCAAVIFVFKCDGAVRKKRNTQEDVTLEFTLHLDDQDMIDLQAMYDTNTVSDDLLDVVQAIADLENVETEVKSLTVTINGDTYTVDPASVTASTSGTCDPGYYSDSASCVPCAAGTYHDSISDFCVLCPKAEYQDEEAQTSCKECNTGYTTAVTGSTMASHCIVDGTYVGPSDDDDDGDNNGKVVGIAVGASIAVVVLIGAGIAIAFRLYMTSKVKGSASLPTQNLIHPNVPSKDKLYSEIENPHFVPPPKPYNAAVNSALHEDLRTATPPGTVLPNIE